MVQTFIVEESKELIYDSDKIQEWKEKCEILGLDKQLALTVKEASPVPFEFMNTVSRRVYETICPAKVGFMDYAKTAIPLEVLGLIHLSVNEKYFKTIQIWYDDKTPDPLAVGVRQRAGSPYEWDNELYLIARWGDVLRPFDELKEMAIRVFTNSEKINLQRKISEAKAKFESIKENAAAYFDAQCEKYDVNPF
jgi:hypothetical protein